MHRVDEKIEPDNVPNARIYVCRVYACCLGGTVFEVEAETVRTSYPRGERLSANAEARARLRSTVGYPSTRLSRHPVSSPLPARSLPHDASGSVLAGHATMCCRWSALTSPALVLRVGHALTNKQKLQRARAATEKDSTFRTTTDATAQ